MQEGSGGPHLHLAKATSLKVCLSDFLLKFIIVYSPFLTLWGVISLFYIQTSISYFTLYSIYQSLIINYCFSYLLSPFLSPNLIVILCFIMNTLIILSKMLNIFFRHYHWIQLMPGISLLTLSSSSSQWVYVVPFLFFILLTNVYTIYKPLLL